MGMVANVELSCRLGLRMPETSLAEGVWSKRSRHISGSNSSRSSWKLDRLICLARVAR